MFIVGIMPHIEVCGGIRRYFEISNEFINQGHRCELFYTRTLNRKHAFFETTALLKQGIPTTHYDVAFTGDPDCFSILEKTDATIKLVFIVNRDYPEKYEALWEEHGNEYLWVGCSSYWAEQFKNKKINGYTIPGGVNTKVFTPIPSLRPKDKTVVIFFRRTGLKRGFENMIKGIHQFQENNPDKNNWIFYAYDTYKVGIETISRYRDINIIPVIVKTPIMLLKLYQSSHIVLSAQENGVWNNIVIEGMACGCAGISTEVAARDFLIDNVTGKIIRPSSPEDIAQALQWYQENPDKIIEHGYAAVDMANKYSWENFTKQLQEIIEKRLVVTPSPKTAINFSYKEQENRKKIKKKDVIWLCGTMPTAHLVKTDKLTKNMPEFNHIRNTIQKKDQVVIALSPSQLTEKWVTNISMAIHHLCTPREYTEEWENRRKVKQEVINWVCGSYTWAYRFIAERFEKYLEFKQVINDKGTIDVYFNPKSCRDKPIKNRCTPNHKIIIRLDGNRIYDENEQIVGSFTENWEEHRMYEKELSECGALIATNKSLYEFGKSINPNTYFITNGVDLDQFSYCYSVKPIGSKFVAGFAGSIIKSEYREYKGYDYVVGACENLGIELKQALFKQQQIDQTQMRDLFYAKIDVLVHPTKGEGTSNVIMEALSCGVPVITTKTAGYHGEMLTDKKNVIFCYRSIESVQRCIKMLMENPTLRLELSHNGRKFAEEHHDIKKIAAQWAEVIRTIFYRQSVNYFKGE